MIEILPVRSLTDEDAAIFGSLNIALAKLARLDFPIGQGIVVTPPQFKLKSLFEKFDFNSQEVFRQSLSLVKKEINSIPVSENLAREVGHHKAFFLNGMKINSLKNLWVSLLNSWFDLIQQRLWNVGFSQGITNNLDPQVVIFTSKIQSFGTAHFDSLQDDVAVLIKEGKLQPKDIKKIAELVSMAQKKLFLQYEYEWILDKEIKLTKVLPYQPAAGIEFNSVSANPPVSSPKIPRSAVKVFFDLSSGLTIEREVDGVYIASEKIFDLNKPTESFENLVFRVVEAAISFPSAPVFMKLADKSEGMGKIRGSLRLLHQSSLLDPLLKVLDFARHKKGLKNIHIVVPFVRGVNELLKMKRDLAIRQLSRKNSLQLWMEAAVLENLVNLENYLLVGIDGLVLNLDELVAHFNGFDPTEAELAFYKNEVDGLLKFLEDGIRLLHKSKIPFIAYGSLALDAKVLEFLVEKGVYGVVVERYEVHSAKDLLSQVERRVILRKT